MNAQKYQPLSHAGGLVVYFYGGLDPLSIPQANLPLSVEEVCEQAARCLSKHLPVKPQTENANGCRMASLTLPMYGLIDEQHETWLSPREKLGQESHQILYFRIRFCIYPFKLTTLRELDSQTWEYLYQQLLDDFLNDRLQTMYRKELELKKLLGFVVVAYFIPRLNDAKADQETILDPNVTLRGLRKHLPKKLRLNFKWPWPYFRLYRSVKEEVSKYRGQMSKRTPVVKFKQTYMNGLLEEVKRYGSEVCAATEVNMVNGAKTDVDVVVDPFASRPAGINFGTTHVCEFSEVQNLALHTFNDNEFGGEVIIVRKNGLQKKVLFKTAKMAQSFVSCVDGYCRLLCDYYYNMCTSATVEPPFVTPLKTLRAFGPMLPEDAEKELESAFMDQEEDFHNKTSSCFLIHQSPESLYDFYILKKIHRDAPTQRDIIHYDGNGFTGNLKDMKDIQCDGLELLKILKIDSRLKRPRTDCSLTTRLYERDEMTYYYAQERVTAGRLDHPTLLGEDTVDVMDSNLIGSGRLTEVYQGSMQINSNDEDEQDVVIKKMAKGQEALQEHLQNGMWKHAKLQSDKKIFIKLYGYMLKAPFRAVLEYVSLKDLQLLLSKAPKPLTLLQVMSVIEQINHGLAQMEDKKMTHGNLRCRNILLARMRNSDLLVKIADPGLESYYNTCPLHSDVNIERLAWVAVERFHNLGAVTLQSEIYAFATTWWELLSEGTHPKEALSNLKTPQQQIDYFRRGGRLPRPASLEVSGEDDPMKDVKEEMWSLIQACWDADPAERPSVKNITRYVLGLCDSVREQTEEIENNEEDSREWQQVLEDITNRTVTIEGGHTIITEERLRVDSTENGKLGEGNFGCVRKGRLKEPQLKLNEPSTKPPRDVAVKSLKKMEPSDKIAFFNEISLASSLNHKNIVKVFGVCCIPTNQLVMEFVERGSVSTYLRELRAVPKPSLLARFCLNVAEGMEYLHSKSIVHRDLAARNVLLNSELVAKITDFGLAKVLKNKDYYKSKDGGIPFLWCAPEAMRYFRFTKEGDVWSYGVLLWEIFYLGKKKPVLVPNANDHCQMLEKGLRLPAPPNCAEGFYDLMNNGCWCLEPSDRSTFKDIVKKVQQLSLSLQ